MALSAFACKIIVPYASNPNIAGSRVFRILNLEKTDAGLVETECLPFMPIHKLAT